MFQTMFCKEFYKIRWLWCVLFLLNVALTIYLWMSTRNLFSLNPSEVVWYRIIQLGEMYFESLRFFPVICGVLIAGVQFLPGISEKFLEQNLSSSLPGHVLLALHLLTGVVALFLACLPSIIGLWAITILYFPHEMVRMNFFTTTPWFLAGMTGYFGGSLVSLEPSLRYRICNVMISLSLAGMYLFRAVPGAYAHNFPFLLIPLFLMALSVFYPALRFAYRRTDS